MRNRQQESTMNTNIITRSRAWTRLCFALIGLGVMNLFVFDDGLGYQSRTRISLRSLEVARRLGVSECSLELEAHMKKAQKKWIKDEVPVLNDLVVVDEMYYAVFNVDGRIGNGIKGHYLDYADDHEWWCDDELGEIIGHDTPGYHTLIVRCNTVSEKIIARPTLDSKSAKEVEYNVEANLKCIHSDPVMFPPDTKIASCTAIKGEEYRELLPQWIEYHHNIGVDHIFVYINEPFADIDVQYSRPYITYVPYDYQNKPYYFQATWQNDCIYRAKNATVSWLGLHDIDEYWQPLISPYKMESVMNYFDPDFDLGMTVGNTWFGPHPNEKETFDQHKKPNKLLMDYSWRSPDHRGPQKCIVSPRLVDYFYVHWVTKEVEGARPMQRLAWLIRMNHYRRPYNHVHEFDDELAIKQLQKDDSMSKQFKDGVVKAIAEDPPQDTVLSTA